MTTSTAPRPVPPSVQPRSSLSQPSCTEIGVLLKQIKLFARNIHAAMTKQNEELQILERLYYKGKNQHRAALFWKRVCEVRRYGRRLDGVGLPGVVERLRLSFFGDDATRSKSRRGSWTHVPEEKYLSFVLERVSACRSLIEKMQERLLVAYRSFTLAMQSGAFIQLVLTLTAVVSRMYFFVSEIRDIILHGLSTFQRTLQILDPTHNMIVGVTVSVTQAVTTSTAVKHPSQMGSAPKRDNGAFEDIRLSSARRHQTLSDNGAGQTQCISGLSVEHGNSRPTAALINNDTVLSMTLLQQIEGAPSPAERAGRTFQNDLITPPNSIPKSKSVRSEHGFKKRRKEKDEIDQIFGD